MTLRQCRVSITACCALTRTGEENHAALMQGGR